MYCPRQALAPGGQQQVLEGRTLAAPLSEAPLPCGLLSPQGDWGILLFELPKNQGAKTGQEREGP